MAKAELVIFDFDGTLVDTAPDIVRATNFYLESQGMEPLPEATIRAEIGLGLRKLIVSLFPEAQKAGEAARIKIEQDFTAIYTREFLHSPALMEGALEFLQRWDGQIAIVSNKRERFIHPILEQLGIDSFPWTSIIGGDTLEFMKPHPAPFMEAIEHAGVTAEETIIVGDGHPDVQGAEAIGSQCVAVDFGYTQLEELMALGAWKSISHFDELLPLLQKIT